MTKKTSTAQHLLQPRDDDSLPNKLQLFHGHQHCRRHPTKKIGVVNCQWLTRAKEGSTLAPIYLHQVLLRQEEAKEGGWEIATRQNIDHRALKMTKKTSHWIWNTTTPTRTYSNDAMCVKGFG